MKKRRFEEINLSNNIQKGIKDMGFEEMSPIQAEAIPVILEGKDIIGQAQTGTGKTAAFGIPILERIDTSNNVQALVLCPTRELSIQVAKEIGDLSKYNNWIKVLPVYGGQPINRQIRALKRGVQIVVGTPGRVIDHIRRKTLKLDKVNMMVLDEADEMFDMGFRDDIQLVMDELSKERQTIFFSATMPREVIKFASKYQKSPEIIRVAHKELTIPKIEQYYLELKEHMKTEILSRLIDLHDPKLTIVFCNTKRKVDRLVGELQSRGYFVDGLHGDLKQNQRDVVMGKFRDSTIDILVATDVAARGLDVDDIDLVINYDIPQDEEYYVHRIGRTARAGRKGVAFSFVTRRDRNKLRDIQRYAKTKIKRKNLPTLKDIEELYQANILDKVKEEIENDKLSKYSKMIDLLIEDEYTSFDIAAALLKLNMDNNRKDRYKGLDRIDSSRKGQRQDNKGTRHASQLGKVRRVYINIGSRQGVTASHIVAAIAQETKVPTKFIGSIDIFDRFTFVDIVEDYVDKVVDNLNNKRIKNNKVKVERANPRRR
ncbi:MAG TPA: DEAD/DEAH box helicase [Tissierellaceae bacterium]|nr:DEAD/DEAH box helicase [Tissierellaceae bacterium]